ncbi:hypothetical protein N7517_001626 [Penicillium concentricum]|uniref:Uncharacterized protein n=1 Tax=Penicillium concentricum TaxID=293559 RepID=A0A9W9ST88_9EURO|nr:uncharacterized protein N7517_001626 [Penicillium concentricum]KAJ5383715.1 hypothetical protein N7517_001626 [Penicillium concentricum]
MTYGSLLDEQSDESKNDSATEKLISLDSSTHLHIQFLYHYLCIRVVPGGNMKLHIRYLIKSGILHNDGVKAAAGNSSGLGKWKVTPPRPRHGRQNPMMPGRGPNQAVERIPTRRSKTQSWNDHGQTEPPKRNLTEPRAVADDS